MKGAFETFLVLFFGMLFLLVGLDFMAAQVKNNQARAYAESSLAILEGQNRYDNAVDTLLNENPYACSECRLSIQADLQDPQRYWVVVNYPLHFRHLNVSLNAEVKHLSRRLS